MSYFSYTSPFIVVSANINMVCPGAPRKRDQTETSFSLKSFQAWRYDTAGTVRVQQKTVARGHGWQGAGKELCLFFFEIFIRCWLQLVRVFFKSFVWQEDNAKNELFVTGTLFWWLSVRFFVVVVFRKPWPHHLLVLIIGQSTQIRFSGNKVLTLSFSFSDFFPFSS